VKRIIPNNDRVRYVEHIEGRGVECFRAACTMDIEGVVCKWRHGVYQIGGSATSWLKCKNPNYSQIAGRDELFANRGEGRPPHGRYVSPRLLLA